MDVVTRSQGDQRTDQSAANLGRFGVLALLALLVLAAAPGLRLLPGFGSALGWATDRAAPAPAKAASPSSSGEAIHRQGSRRVAAQGRIFASTGGPAPDAPAFGLFAAGDLPATLRTAIRIATPARVLIGGGLPRPYDPRAPPLA